MMTFSAPGTVNCFVTTLEASGSHPVDVPSGQRTCHWLAVFPTWPAYPEESVTVSGWLSSTLVRLKAMLEPEIASGNWRAALPPFVCHGFVRNTLSSPLLNACM